jgi:hypothetical protein
MKQPPSSPDAQRSASAPRDAERGVARQLARLFGEGLFGAWQDPLDAMAAGRRERKRGRWGKRLGIVLLLAVAAGAGAWLYQRGLARRAEHERAQVAKEVATFLADGELDRLAQFVDILLPPGQPLLAGDPYLDLVVSAEAALYRYRDAAPARLARIEPYLGASRDHPARLLARLTVSSRPERAAAHDALAGLAPSFAMNPEYHTLMALLLEQRGDHKGAAASWNLAAQAGPLWLPHRYQECAFEARRRNAAAVARITGHMAKVAPESAWTRLAHQHFAPSTAPRTVPTTPTAPSTTAPRPPSPVAQYHAELAQVFPSLAAKDMASARTALGRALASVNGQTSFVLDAFAALLDAKAESLAVEMTSYETWPRGNPWAQAKLAELQAAARRATPPTVEPAPEPEPKPAAKPAKAKKAGKAKKRAGKAKKQRSQRRK